MNFKSYDSADYDDMVSLLANMSYYIFPLKRFDLDLKNRENSSTKPSIEEIPILELKDLPSNLYCALLGSNNTFLVITLVYLVEWQIKASVSILEKFNRTIGWSIGNFSSILLKHALIKSNSGLFYS